VTATHVREVLPVDTEGGGEPTTRRATLPDALGLDRSLTETLDEYERTLITRALSVAGGNVAEAARRLQTDRPNLYRRMRRLGISGANGVA
jgi:transcriptional regulator with GAF, ATPase, and Fis domain